MLSEAWRDSGGGLAGKNGYAWGEWHDEGKCGLVWTGVVVLAKDNRLMESSQQARAEASKDALLGVDESERGAG